MSAAPKKKALIIGAAGFVGRHLALHLQQQWGWQVAATRLAGEALDIPGLAAEYELDVCDAEAVGQVLQAAGADYVFHLAAQSSVGLSWKQPALTVQVNVLGTLHLLEAARALGTETRLLLVGSGEEYGYVRSGEVPINEEVLPRPGNIYAVTKNTQNQLAAVYARAYGLQVVSTRSFNHIGPGQQRGFVVPDFCSQVAQMEAGQTEPRLLVGNLAAKRDFCDVRDIVRAYALLAQRGQPGETYNVGSGRAVAVSQLLEEILALAKVDIEVQQDPARMRPADVPLIEADIQKLQNATGWKPQIELKDTLRDTLAYWRNQIKQAGKA